MELEVWQLIVIVSVGFVLLIALGGLAFFAKFYRKVDQGKALIINTPKDTIVTFRGGVVIPIIHRAEVMDISLKTIEIDRRGHEGLICKDNIRGDIKVTFFVRVNKDEHDVLRVAQSVGCARASDPVVLEELFNAKFSEALKTVGKGLDFEELYEKRDDFRDAILRVIGEDLNGYSLEDAAIDYLEQTPVEKLDPDNILDARGIKKITEMTAEQRVLTNERRNEAKKRIGDDNLNTHMAMLDFERREKEAEAKQKRAVAEIEATEGAAAAEQEALATERKEKARLEAEQKINIQQINKQREEEVAEKERQRVMAIKTEEVEKERSLQAVERERTVELSRIEKTRQVEVKKKDIADVVRDRVAVERGVAEEEERIKDTRVLAEAERSKKTKVIDAEGQAESQLVEKIKAAEANEEVAKFQAREQVIAADAQLDAADRQAKAKIRMAEGIQAEVAAEGLAQVRVQEAEATAIEKRGMVEARVLQERMVAEAKGSEEQGLVQVRLKEADAQAREKEGVAIANITRTQMEAEAEGSEKKGLAKARVIAAEAEAKEKEGLVEATVLREKLTAEAEGTEKRGLADARVIEASALAEASGIEKKLAAEASGIERKLSAEASGIERRELAEATGIEKKLLAEAAGLSEKAAAMKQFNEATRDHEEFRLRLEHERAISLEQIRTQVEISKAQAAVLGEAFKAADIQIVGGEGDFFERFMGAISMGKTVEGLMNESATVRRVVDRVVGPANGTNGHDGEEKSRGPALMKMLDSLRAEVSGDTERQGLIDSLITQVRDAGLHEHAADLAEATRKKAAIDVSAEAPEVAAEAPLGATPKEPAEA